MKRVLLLVTLALMLAAAMALSGVAQGRADVCVSIKGSVKVDKGGSLCSSDTTSQAIAIKDSQADADFGSNATATNGSDALASVDSTARATNGSQAEANGNCTATAQNGENASCP